jgi:hypothetical protein
VSTGSVEALKDRLGFKEARLPLHLHLHACATGLEQVKTCKLAGVGVPYIELQS